MLKLVLVGHGKKQRLTQYVHILQSEMAHFVKQYKFRIYNMKKLSMAEVKPELLETNSRLCFSTNKDTQLRYCGVTNKVSLSELHSRFFDGNFELGTIIKKGMKYSRNNLRTVVKNWLTATLPDCQENSELFDLYIEYQYISLGVNDACIMEICLNQNILYQAPINFFQNLIIKLDTMFADVFSSAYITNGMVNFIDAFFQRPIFDKDMLDSKIIDIGYIFYVSKFVKKVNGFGDIEDLGRYKGNRLLNGTLYKFDGRIDEWNRCLNSFSEESFDKMKIPQYRFFNWSDLCIRKWFPISVDETISVYFDAYSDGDPTVVVSFGYTFDQLDSLPMLFDCRCVERYMVKDAGNAILS